MGRCGGHDYGLRGGGGNDGEFDHTGDGGEVIQNSELRIQNFGFGFESWIRKSRKLNKNSPYKARGSTRRGRECVFNSKFWIYRLLRHSPSECHLL